MVPSESEDFFVNGTTTTTTHNESSTLLTTIKIVNELETGDAASLIAFFVFLFAMVCVAVCVYYGSGLRLWVRQTLVFPCRRLCCEGERNRLWQLHKVAVMNADRALSVELRNPLNEEERSETDFDPLEAQLSTLVGLEPLKNEIRALRRTLVVEEQRRRVLGGTKKALKTHAPHMIFRGNPGTGKTHAARLIARLLKELGYVNGDIVEVQRADLVAGYVGQTQHKTRAVINRAKGAVLFVDEAYALAPKFAEGGRDFGSEAIQELMRDLTSGDPVVILAGYTAEMERFLAVNPGLSRRFQVRFTFHDYSYGELAAIFTKIVARKNYRLDASASDVEALLQHHFDPDLCRKWNGGLPEGLFRRAQDALARRLNVMTMSAEVALTITYDDITQASRILRATLGDASPRPTPRRQLRRHRRRTPGDAASGGAASGASGASGAASGASGAAEEGRACPEAGLDVVGENNDDDDDNIYEDDDDDDDDERRGLLREPTRRRRDSAVNGGGLESLLANPDALVPAFTALHTLTPRVAALEAAVARLVSAGDSSSQKKTTNPWENV
eukprot:CAMPEP_0118918406 /NCGR_PEP_ID=MMETSP1166-20130328/17898_1 /TAXON_ID=1104430 /ORGANISM="Chrysoreinhardia sp, Strain CCMP3193" /LENGTH=558 /DNA_ID=CAMNT_0006858707 /DNA_START=90 /DNA_END=1766 /DNA_ORIENTATION=-